MGDVVSSSPPLPAYAMLPATGVFVILIVLLIRRTTSPSAGFVYAAVWLRFMLAAYNRVTFAPSPLGLSWNALFSVATIAVGLLIVRWRHLSISGLVPVGAVIVAVALSGATNHDIPGLIEMVVKYLYFAVITIAVTGALADLGRDRFLGSLLWPFVVPVGLQAISLALGVVKINEQDGTPSYIGGFYHEAAFSVALSAGLFIACMQRQTRAPVKILLILGFVASIALANYRTAILAMAPLVAATFFAGAVRSFVPHQRPLIAGAMLLVLVCGGIASADLAKDRFADIGTIAERGTGIIKPPESFTNDDRAIMSGRALIWSQYLYGFAAGSPKQKLFGFGPDSGETAFGIYAHNTLISSLYELGVFGCASILLLWLWMLALAFGSGAESRFQLVAAHLGFFVLNMATMPMWMVEGMMFYGLLCGYTIYMRDHSRAPEPRSATVRTGPVRWPAGWKGIPPEAR
jgi:hypothetical protein